MPVRTRGARPALIGVVLAALVLVLVGPCVATAGSRPRVATAAGPRRPPGASGGVGVRPSPGGGDSAPRSVHPALASGDPLSGRAMWIWELAFAGHGDPRTIARTARLYGIATVIVKSSDGTRGWSQFSRPLVEALHAVGLRVCAWQYVYGNHPLREADLGAGAVRLGADCLVIDAESEYQGKYVSAQRYLERLRSQIGAGYPLALAGLPYVDYHPAFPYSVFLGPDGAQDNMPQMYWKDIGVTVDRVFAHTYAYNLIYGRPIYPLGQVYSHPPARQIVRFRELARAYGASGVSWWDWQEASHRAWLAVSRPAGVLSGYVPYEALATIRRRAVGDLVVWAQEHLVSAGYDIAVDGRFWRLTWQAVLAFQAAHGLTADGVIGPETWAALLRYAPVRVIWGDGNPRPAVAAGARAGARAARVLALPPPASAGAPAQRDELAGSPGAGAPSAGHPR